MLPFSLGLLCSSFLEWEHTIQVIPRTNLSNESISHHTLHCCMRILRNWMIQWHIEFNIGITAEKLLSIMESIYSILVYVLWILEQKWYMSIIIDYNYSHWDWNVKNVCQWVWWIMWVTHSLSPTASLIQGCQIWT